MFKSGYIWKFHIRIFLNMCKCAKKRNIWLKLCIFTYFLLKTSIDRIEVPYLYISQLKMSKSSEKVVYLLIFLYKCLNVENVADIHISIKCLNF